MQKIKQNPLADFTFAGLLIGTFSFIYNFFDAGKTAETKKKSIAVLPFKPLSANNEYKYLGLGMADALKIKLGQLNQTIVRPTGNIRQYADQPQVDAVSVGQNLQVETGLEGTIQRIGDRVRVTVQLINVSSGQQIWADKFEENSNDLFGVQDTIALRVSNSVTAKLTNAEQKELANRETDSPEAFQLYVRGIFFANQETTEGFKKALEHLNKAVELDPDYALAYTALSRAYRSASEWHLPPSEAMPKARSYAQQAIRLDETLSEGHQRLGWVKMLYDWDWVDAESEFKRVMKLNPNNAEAHSSYSGLLSFTGRHQEAIAEAKRVEEINPLETGGVTIYFLARNYDQAI